MQPTYQSEDSQSQAEQSSQDSLDNSQISDPGLTNRKRKRPSIDQSEAGPVNSQRNAEEANLKRLDFSQEIRNADLPDKRKEELLEFDDRIRDQRTFSQKIRKQLVGSIISLYKRLYILKKNANVANSKCFYR